MREDNFSQDIAKTAKIKQSAPGKPKKQPKKITEKYLYNSGLAYLQRFPASTAHFRRVMSRKIDRSCNCHKEQSKEECGSLLNQTVETFLRMGLLNDDLYLEGMINSLRRRGQSSQAIFAKLQMKGLAQSSVKAALQDYDERQDNPCDPEITAALLLARRKRLGPYRRQTEADRNKELAGLARAGFGFDLAQKILSMTLEDAEGMLALRF